MSVFHLYAGWQNEQLENRVYAKWVEYLWKPAFQNDIAGIKRRIRFFTRMALSLYFSYELVKFVRKRKLKTEGFS